MIIPGTLPGLNEIIDAAKKGKRGYQPYSHMKQEYTQIIMMCARGMKKHEKPVDVIVNWYEPNSRRDPDNIQAGIKFILDSLVKASIIPNDTQKYIKSITHKVNVDKNRPRVEVELKED